MHGRITYHHLDPFPRTPFPFLASIWTGIITIKDMINRKTRAQTLTLCVQMALRGTQ
jgi:hypothetical protein